MRFLTVAGLLAVLFCTIALASARYGDDDEYERYPSSPSRSKFEYKEKTDKIRYKDSKDDNENRDVKRRLQAYDGKVDISDDRYNNRQRSEKRNFDRDASDKYLESKRRTGYGSDYETKRHKSAEPSYSSKKKETYRAPVEETYKAPAKTTPYKAPAAEKSKVPALPSGGDDDGIVVQNVNGNRNKNSEEMKGKNEALSQNGNSNSQKKLKTKQDVRKRVNADRYNYRRI
jgi:hypothetical protein